MYVVKGADMTDAQRFYILSMMVITAKRRYGAVKLDGVVRVLRAIKYLSKQEVIE